jgi:hypothetical protein
VLLNGIESRYRFRGWYPLYALDIAIVIAGFQRQTPETNEKVPFLCPCGPCRSSSKKSLTSQTGPRPVTEKKRSTVSTTTSSSPVPSVRRSHSRLTQRASSGSVSSQASSTGRLKRQSKIDYIHQRLWSLALKEVEAADAKANGKSDGKRKDADIKPFLEALQRETGVTNEEELSAPY